LPSVNIYTSLEFLDVIATVYFAGRRCHVQDHVVAGQVYRLLVVDGLGPVVKQTFVDLHEPLGPATRHSSLPTLARLQGACLPQIPMAELRQQPGGEAPMGAPSIVWRDFSTWEDYLQVLRTRRVLAEDMRRARRLASILGPVSFEVDDTADDVLPTCCAWKSARDLELGRPDLFAIEANRRFFPALRARGLLRASTLRAGGQLLAVWLGAVHQRRWSGWVFTFNPKQAFNRFSLGRQLLYPMLQESHRAGHAEFDFSIGMEFYKLNFATHVRPIGLAGHPPAVERAASAMKQWLSASPWCYAKAKVFHHWLRHTPNAASNAISAPNDRP
jgi:hypothetical protein